MRLRRVSVFENVCNFTRKVNNISYYGALKTYTFLCLPNRLWEPINVNKYMYVYIYILIYNNECHIFLHLLYISGFITQSSGAATLAAPLYIGVCVQIILNLI